MARGPWRVVARDRRSRLSRSTRRAPCLCGRRYRFRIGRRLLALGFREDDAELETKDLVSLVAFLGDRHRETFEEPRDRLRRDIDVVRGELIARRRIESIDPVVAMDEDLVSALIAHEIARSAGRKAGQVDLAVDPNLAVAGR